MLAIEIEEHARKLMEVQGPKAIAEAARKARNFEKDGAADEASHLAQDRGRNGPPAGPPREIDRRQPTGLPTARCLSPA